MDFQDLWPRGSLLFLVFILSPLCVSSLAVSCKDTCHWILGFIQIMQDDLLHSLNMITSAKHFPNEGTFTSSRDEDVDTSFSGPPFSPLQMRSLGSDNHSHVPAHLCSSFVSSRGFHTIFHLITNPFPSFYTDDGNWKNYLRGPTRLINDKARQSHFNFFFSSLFVDLLNKSTYWYRLLFFLYICKSIVI